MECHVCAVGEVVEARDFNNLGRTASDCKPWRPGGRIGVCCSCAIVQKLLDTTWQAESDEIYSDYFIYHQSPSRSEQPIYISQSDRWVPRSEAILLNFINIVGDNVLTAGIAMDIGCGNGATLHAMARVFPNHARYGFDPTATNIGALESRLELQVTACSRELKDLPKSYDLLTMIHVLEHIPQPLPILRSYVDMLTSNGYFLIVVPNFLENPFDITIADHCSHFCKDSLINLLSAAGLEIINLSTTNIPKEIMAICKRSNKELKASLIKLDVLALENQRQLSAQIQWLYSIREQVTSILNKDCKFGVFGTSIAGNWMYGEWSNKISFFVDEDPERLGTTYRGVPVLSISDLNDEDAVYIALPPAIAFKVKQRYKGARCKIYIPDSVLIDETTYEDL